MATRNSSLVWRLALGLGMMILIVGTGVAGAQAPAAGRQLGTVKAIAGDTVTLTTDAGQTVTVSIPSTARVLELAVGSTDLKTAKPSQFSDIAVGDRVLAVGAAGDTPASLTARTVVVMKSADIAKMQAEEQADWRANGVGGIVSSVDPATGAITIESGPKKIVIDTTSKTVFKRFAGDSVKYQDAKPGTLAEIKPKDQLQARGVKSADGLTVQAAEVISGSFENLSGLLLSVDATAGKITLKDLATKKVVTVDVTPNSDLRNMPAMVAARFAAQTNGGGRQGASAQNASAAGGNGARRAAGADLSQMINRFPTITIADLHKGDAVMIVASESGADAGTLTAVTLLTGVDPILTANPNGGMDLSSWSMGGGSSGGEGGPQ